MLGRKQLSMWLFILVGCLALLPGYAYAASVGQIKGQVTDEETGEPIVGASVLVVGTKFGAMTDLEGKYTILRLDPGTYDLRISHIDHNNVEVSRVEVKADLTVEQDVVMSSKVTDIGKTIKVVADRDVIRKFETSNQISIGSEEIKKKPVQTVDALLDQVAGVQTTATGEVFIRGGRAGEVSYIVDGVPIGDPLGALGQAGANLSLASGSIQEIQIIKDGFDPEYGDALSGIVKITTRTGQRDNTRINMQYMTDDFGNSELNKYSRNYDYLRFSISGPDPLLKDKVLPALGLNFLADKEFTYYFYAEAEKSDGVYRYDEFDTPATERNRGFFDLFGLDITDRQNDRYYWVANVKFRPKQNLKFILSYKNSERRGLLFSPAGYDGFGWPYRYSSSTAPVYTDNWNSISLEVSQAINKNTSYEAVFSYYQKEYTRKPGDPDNPGEGLDPDQFPLQANWETFNDRNGNGVYDAPEPIINMYPDTASYGTDFTGPAYSFGELLFEQDLQGGVFNLSDFRFNNNGYVDFLQGEPFVDLNGNGIWDRGDELIDKNGNKVLDDNLVSHINQRTPEVYIDGDSVLGEPFNDLNRNGFYDPGIDEHFRSADPSINQDLNYNGIYDGPSSQWEPGIPFLDRNGNGVYDAPNGSYDPGEPFIDRNGNGTFDDGGAADFLDPMSYDTDARWLRQKTETYRGEVKVFRQFGAHEVKGGFSLRREVFSYEDIKRPYLPYTGRPDGGVYAERGAFRDFFSYEPVAGNAYVRDKLEYGSMVANLGVRWDFFLQDAGELADVLQSDDVGGITLIGDRHKISPRIGFSYPISDKAKVHFNYGHFFQLPAFRWMYARNTSSVDQNDVIGNPNLDYQKTIQYSFGVKYAINENYAIDISGYFKDEFDKINSAQIREGGLTRQQYLNSDYGRSRGFELQLEKRGGGYVSGQINYTYAFAFGKASQTNENYQSDFELSREPLSEAPLNNDIRHSLKTAVNFYVPSTVKPKLFGLPIPNGWSLSVESVIESGAPFTPSSTYPNFSTEAGVDPERNSLRLPSTVVFDVRFAKEFNLIGLDYQFILWIENLFDNRNVQYVYSNTGRPDTQQNIDGVVFGGTAYDQDPANWDYGRQIRMGLEVDL